jgi:EthD domain
VSGQPALYSRLVLGVGCRDPQSPDGVHSRLRDEARRALQSLDAAGSFARIAFPIPPSVARAPRTDYDELLDHGLMNGVQMGGVDAVLDIAIPSSGDRQSLVDAIAGFGDRHADVFDLPASIAVIGTDFVILDGVASIQLFYFMRRNPSITLAEFTDTWRDQHTKIAQFTPGLSGYRQLHVDDALSESAAVSAGVGLANVDGVALEWFDGVEAFISATSAPPEFLEQAKASESRFNDLGAVTAVLTDVRETLLGAGDARRDEEYA